MLPKNNPQVHYGSIFLDMMSGEYQTEREIYF